MSKNRWLDVMGLFTEITNKMGYQANVLDIISEQYVCDAVSSEGNFVKSRAFIQYKSLVPVSIDVNFFKGKLVICALKIGY